MIWISLNVCSKSKRKLQNCEGNENGGETLVLAKSVGDVTMWVLMREQIKKKNCHVTNSGLTENARHVLENKSDQGYTTYQGFGMTTRNTVDCSQQTGEDQLCCLLCFCGNNHREFPHQKKTKQGELTT